MKSLRKTLLQTLKVIFVFVFILTWEFSGWLQIHGFPPKAAESSAATASNRSDILSDSRPSVTSNHTFAFTVNNAVQGSSVSGSSTLNLAFSSNFTIPSNFDCGDVNVATGSYFNFNWPACQATATAWGMTVTTGISYVQSNSRQSGAASSSNTIVFNSNNTAGDLIVVGANWDSTANVSSITDSEGNLYATAIAATTWSGIDQMQLFYAKNIKGGANTVTVKLSGNDTNIFDVYIHEYSGVDTVSPLDATSVGTAASGTSMNSGTSTTHFANELIFGYGATGAVSAPGPGFTARETVDANMTEDKTVGATGAYNATETSSNGSNPWIMAMATFKAASTITLIPPSDTAVHIATTTPMTIWLGLNATTTRQGVHTITNPSTAGIYAIVLGGTSGNSGNFEVSINGPVTVSATMAESLSFTINGIKPISLVQSNSNVCAATTTCSCALSSSVATGDLLVLGLDWGNQSGTLAITDNGSGTANTYPALPSTPESDQFLNGNELFVNYAVNAENAGAVTYTFTISGGGSHTLRTSCFDYTAANGWVAQASVVDASSVNFSSAGTVLSGNGGNITPAAAGELIWSGLENIVPGGGSVTSYTVSACALQDTDSNAVGTGWGGTGRAESADNENSGNAQTTCSFTFSTGSAYSAAIAAFKPATGGCTADDGATVTQINTAATAVPFGTVTPNTFYQGCQDLSVSTNAGGGYSLAGWENTALLASNGQTIPDTTCDNGLCTAGVTAGWANPANNGFGHTCNNQVGHDCNAIYASGSQFRPFANTSAATTDWYNPAWSYRKRIVIADTSVSGTAGLVNFPALINRTDAAWATKAFGGHVVSATGSDFVVTAGDGVTKLNDEVESYASSTGAFVAWVNIPFLSTTSTNLLYVYYGNGSQANQQNATGVWNSNYAGVWHLGATSTLNVRDSTANANDGNNNGATPSTGQVDGAGHFNGSVRVEVDSAASRVQTGDVTMSGWINLDASSGCPASTSQAIIYSADPASNNPVGLYLRQSKCAFVMSIFDGAAYQQAIAPATSYTGGVWYYVAGTFSGANGISLYINGSLSALNATSTTRGTTPYATHAAIGSLDDAEPTPDYTTGSIDEARISNIARPGSWIATEYNNQSSPSTFMSFGTEEQPWTGDETGPVIMASSTPAIATGRVKFRLSVGSTQPAGVYSNTIVYTVTPTY